jgi:hypothetical protein
MEWWAMKTIQRWTRKIVCSVVAVVVMKTVVRPQEKLRKKPLFLPSLVAPSWGIWHRLKLHWELGLAWR